MISKEKKAELIKAYGRKEGDTGSPEVQIAILTAHRGAQRAPECKSEGSPFEKRSSHDGRSEKKPARLSEEDGS